ncbi:hypothetical protein R1flu_016492 [Riccia fluitans]|uniref:HNH homing endonuclease n=1 Tax=Riccia fluitans TaxID=41844 RepID=A0ABD1YMI7_9MARC
MLKYVTSLQRHCVPEDIFLWGIMNTDAEGDRLLVKNTRRGTNVIGWNEIAIIFGAKHIDKEHNGYSRRGISSDAPDSKPYVIVSHHTAPCTEIEKLLQLKEDFRFIKIMHTMLDKYNPRS